MVQWGVSSKFLPMGPISTLCLSLSVAFIFFSWSRCWNLLYLPSEHSCNIRFYGNFSPFTIFCCSLSSFNFLVTQKISIDAISIGVMHLKGQSIFRTLAEQTCIISHSSISLTLELNCNNITYICDQRFCCWYLVLSKANNWNL